MPTVPGLPTEQKVIKTSFPFLFSSPLHININENFLYSFVHDWQVLSYLLALPKALLSNPADSMLVYQGRKLSCSVTANGTFPIYVAIVLNSSVLVNKTKTAEVVLMDEGNYSCVATNKYGSDTKAILVSFLRKSLVFVLFCFFLTVMCKPKHIIRLWQQISR